MGSLRQQWNAPERRRPCRPSASGAAPGTVCFRVGHSYRLRPGIAPPTDDAHFALRERYRYAVRGKETPDVQVDRRAHARRSLRRVLDPEAEFAVDALGAED